jgi:hypothetical protein
VPPQNPVSSSEAKYTLTTALRTTAHITGKQKLVLLMYFLCRECHKLLRLLSPLLSWLQLSFYLRNSALTLFPPITVHAPNRRETSMKAPLIFNELHSGGGKKQKQGVEMGRGGAENLYQTRRQTFALYFGCPVTGKQK